MRRASLIVLLTIIVVLAGSAVSFANQVTEIQYTFFAQIGSSSESAQFLVPNFVTQPESIPASQLESCQVLGAACSSVDLIPNISLQGNFFDEIRINTPGFTGVGYAFPQDSFDNVGVYFDISGSALLSVQRFTFTETPEPSSLLLMGSGTLGIVGLLRRRLMAPRQK